MSANEQAASGAPTVHMAYAEIVRSGLFVLRAMGFSFSLADRAVRTLATAEALTGLALKHLRENESRLRVTPNPWLATPIRTDGLTILHGGGKTLLEIGAFVCDLVTARARMGDEHALLVDDVCGLPFVSDLAIRALHRRLGLACIYREPAGTSGAFLVVPRGADGHGALTGGCVSKGAAVTLANAMLTTQSSCIAPGGALRGWLASGHGATSDLQSGSLLIRGFHPGSPVADTFAAAFPSPPADRRHCDGWHSASAWPERLSAAQRYGLNVAKEDADFFFGAMTKAWVPTSARSRRQNG